MQHKSSVLVVEDDPNLREALCDTVISGGRQVIAAANGAEALEHLKQDSVDLVLSDIQMDVMDGYSLLKKVKRAWPELPVVMITAHGAVDSAVRAMRYGASDYLQKPFEAEVLFEVIERFTSKADTGHTGFSHLIAEDPASQNTFNQALRVADTTATVLISGESGTGKEVIARYIHENSARRDKPFIAVNCAAIPENMLESMLFGYEKGAYTGAFQSRPGKFELANGGTLLLDEISEMDISLQAKLLRVLQEKEVERLGSNKLIKLDVRVLATTNRDMRQCVSEGLFREDLYYRLNVFPIFNPSLMDRQKDIIPLAKHFLDSLPNTETPRLSKKACEKLLSHDWPGNVRELENCMQRAAILCIDASVDADDIVFEATGSRAFAYTDQISEIQASQPDSGNLQSSLKALEGETILDALRNSQGCRKQAAEDLGISPRTLRYKLARLREQGANIPG